MFGVAAVATPVYHVIPTGAGLAIAMATGALATALAVRWESQGIAALGLVGAMLAPAVGGGLRRGTGCRRAVRGRAPPRWRCSFQGWRWLSFGVVLLALPQWVALPARQQRRAARRRGGARSRSAHWARWPPSATSCAHAPERMSASSAFLLVLNALGLGGPGWFAL